MWTAHLREEWYSQSGGFTLCLRPCILGGFSPKLPLHLKKRLPQLSPCRLGEMNWCSRQELSCLFSVADTDYSARSYVYTISVFHQRSRGDHHSACYFSTGHRLNQLYHTNKKYSFFPVEKNTYALFKESVLCIDFRKTIVTIRFNS